MSLSTEREWNELKIEIPSVVPASVYDAVINRLFELGAEGVTEEEGTGKALKAFFHADKTAEAASEIKTYLVSLTSLFPELPAMVLTVAGVKIEDWSIKYREWYQPQKLTNLFYLQPLWNRNGNIPDGMMPIVMDPGQAFGTGLHPTTKLCLSLLEASVDRLEDIGSSSVLDVGTGTAILAIAAEKLGFKKIFAIDNDPLAVEVARENCVENQSMFVNVSGTPLESVSESYDLIVANILLETHRELLGLYSKLLKQRGLLVLSGVLGHQGPELKTLFTQHGFTSEITETLQEWTAVLLVRDPALVR